MISALNVFSKSTHAFDDDAVHLAECFATPAAATVQNAHALDDAIRLARAVDRRADIDHAIGIAISRTGASPAEAFAYLRALSRRENRPLADVATAMIDRAARRPR